MAKTKKTAKKPTRGKAKSAKATKKPALKAKAKAKSKAKPAPKKKKAAAKKPAARKAAPKQADMNGNGESPSMAESPVPEIMGNPPMDGGQEGEDTESDEGDSSFE